MSILKWKNPVTHHSSSEGNWGHFQVVQSCGSSCHAKAMVGYNVTARRQLEACCWKRMVLKLRIPVLSWFPLNLSFVSPGVYVLSHYMVVPAWGWLGRQDGGSQGSCAKESHPPIWREDRRLWQSEECLRGGGGVASPKVMRAGYSGAHR